MKARRMWWLLALAGSGSIFLAGAVNSPVRTPPARLVADPWQTGIQYGPTQAGSKESGRVRLARTGVPASAQVSASGASLRIPRRSAVAHFSLPMTFEPNAEQADPRVRWIGRGRGLTVFLTSREIGVRLAASARRPQSRLGIRLEGAPHLAWRGEEKLPGESNYFIGRDKRAWRTHVRHFARVQAANVAPGVSVVVYGNDEGLEYDVRFAPGARVSKLRLRISGAGKMRLLKDGDLLLDAGQAELRMKRPSFYEEWPDNRRKRVEGGYILRADGSIGFRVSSRDAGATLVADPSLSVTYATFLGGSGEDSANSLAVDKSGKIYVAGTTASAANFPGLSGTILGPASGPSQLFIAKIDPTVSGPNSLLYLTFLGGSKEQAGGLIAVDGSGDVAITGTTTSGDFPVTDSSTLASGTNSLAVSEIDPTGSQLVFSTLLGGTGAISQNGLGGIALDSSGDVYVATDTTAGSGGGGSPGLPVTANAFQTGWDGSASDGFLVVVQPPSSSGGAPVVKYCSYLGTNSSGPVGVGGVAVDGAADAYIAGFTNNSTSGFPAQNAFQSAYGGGDSDAFLMKISPSGQGLNDLIYATLLGGSGTDEGLAVAIDSATPPNAYVTGATQSADFPLKGATAGYQTALKNNATSNVFLAVVAQDGATGATSLAYGTYLGGTGADAGQAIAVSAPNAVYIAGVTTSWDFPWRDNAQPFNGAGDAFVAKLDATSAGAASLLYATPLGGTSPVGGTAGAEADAIATDGAGNVFVAGATTATDFPTAVTTAGSVNGLEQSCASCSQPSPASDAFVVVLHENASSLSPSVYFSAPRTTFPPTQVGAIADPQPVALLNAGEAALSIADSTDISITGPNAADFSLSDVSGCVGDIEPGSQPHCSFEVSFAPRAAGPEGAFVTVTDNAPGSPHLFELAGSGTASLEISPTTLNFGSVPQGSTSAEGTLTFTNSAGNSVQNLSAVLAGPDATEFQASQGTCATITSKTTCVLGFVFQPQATGAFHAELDISYQLGSTSQPGQVIPLSGVGTSPMPVASVAPLALTFGSQATGTTSNPQTVTLSNQGSAPLNLTSIAIAGANAGDFSISTTGTTCPILSGSLGFGFPPPSCTIAVQFSPQAAGNRNAQLRITDNAVGSPQEVALRGTAAAPPPSVEVSPASIDFGAQSEGTSSNAQSVSVTNPGTAVADISGIALGGSNPGDFVLGNSCAGTLAAGANCALSVTFKPAVGLGPGSRAGVLNVPGGTPSAVSLSATATQAAISYPTTFNFGSQLAGTPSSGATAQPVTVTNSSNGSLAGGLAVTGASVFGTNSGDFLLAGNSCASGLTPPGGTCTIQVKFAPVQAASCGTGSTRSATLVLQDNAPGSPHSIPLSGTATDFCLDSASGQGISSTVTAGQTATYNLTVDSSAGFSGTLSLACTDTVLASDCTITTTPATSPASVQVSAGTPGQFSVSVATTASVATRFVRWRPGSPVQQMGRVIFFTLLALLAVWLLNLRTVCAGRLAGGLPKLAPMGAALLVVALLLGMAACGSGGDSPSTGQTGTPAGSYTITISATASNGASRTVALGLTVQ